MTEQLKQYFANWNIKHNSERFGVDDPISLNEKDAKPLLDSGAVREPIKGDTATTGNSNKVDELTEDQKFQTVYDAIGGLDKDVTTNWIGNGAPDCNVLTGVIGFDVSSKLSNDAWTKFQSESE